ncbi:adenine-specific DNA-methyltransferase [Bradyrhizobium sp. LB7.2]|uniref:DNA-methyltransferase n=1 Tax=Bradyrhizobium sp. LB14.3 TaxID=3156328 RepID=UPI00339576F7
MLQVTSPKIIPTATFHKGDVLSVLRKLPKTKFDLIVTSPPYNIGKIYERSEKLTFEEYVEWLDKIIGASVDALQDHGSICWQVGSFVKDGEIFPIDIYTYDSFKRRGMKLRNRIIWRFNFGLHSKKRLSGRYETILWFTKSDDHRFNLDAVRVPQLYPGKRHPKARAKDSGKPSGNPLGKNPSDYWEFSAEEYFQNDPVWDIPNVKANHPEKTIHPCQFPVELVERCVLALTDPGDTVLDPFMGTGTTAIAAMKHSRHAVGIDKDGAFLKIAKERVKQLLKGTLKIRHSGKPTRTPQIGEKVATVPEEWKQATKRRR